MIYFWFVAVAVIAYLVGSINYSIIVSEVFMGTDIRKKGSGNAGSTNMLRNYGLKAALVTLLSDFMKTFVATLSAWAIFSIYYPEHTLVATSLAGLFCAIGHCFPLYFGFKGGKGVAVGAIMILMTDYRSFIVALAVFVLLVAITKYVSLGSVSAGISFPISLAFFVGFDTVGNCIRFVLACVLAIMVAILHRHNIVKWFKGTESKISFKK